MSKVANGRSQRITHRCHGLPRSAAGDGPSGRDRTNRRGLVDTGDMSLDAPEPDPSGATGREAVEICRQWMAHLGAVDVVVAEGSAADICDLYSSRYLAWVQSRRGNLELGVVEHAAAVGSVDGRSSLVFLRGGVFPTVQDRADNLAVGLLRFDPRTGALDGANAVGRRILASGLVG